jgi:hypothetical protein
LQIAKDGKEVYIGRLKCLPLQGGFIFPPVSSLLGMTTPAGWWYPSGWRVKLQLYIQYVKQV